MRKRLLISLPWSGAFLMQAPAQGTLEGDGLGSWQHKQKWVSVKVNCKTEADTLKATLDVQDDSLFGWLRKQIKLAK